jgi:thymidine phosphorylase
VVDAAVGIVLHKKTGDEVQAGEPLCTVYYNSEKRMNRMRDLLAGSFHVDRGHLPESDELRPAGKKSGIVRKIVRDV